MINILLVDDSNDKIAKIIKAIRELSENIHIDVVIDFVLAQDSLIKYKYDLLILDMNLPVRQGDIPSMDTGKNLLKEIDRKENINSPNYIVSLTQYADVCIGISEIWPTVKYIPESDVWKKSIEVLIKHIIKSNNFGKNDLELKPTIFFEGKTDVKIFHEALSIFRPDLIPKIDLKSGRSAGASWVARQIIVWAHSLKKDAPKSYLKAVAIFDGDSSGKESIDEIKRVIKSESAEQKTFKVIKLSQTYARHIIPIKKKGVDIPICLEEMFAIEHWKYANNRGWLETRNKPDSFLSEPGKWDRYNISLKDYLSSMGLTEDEKLYLNCVNDLHKEDFANYIVNDVSEKKGALSSFEKLISEIADFFEFPQQLS